MGLGDPSLSSWPFLDQVLRGIRRSSPAHSRAPRLPITPWILQELFASWSRPPVSPDYLMLWAACCVGFFGFMRAGEFTCPSLAAFSESMLSPSDVRVDYHSDPMIISLHLHAQFQNRRIWCRGVGAHGTSGWFNLPSQGPSRLPGHSWVHSSYSRMVGYSPGPC